MGREQILREGHLIEMFEILNSVNYKIQGEKFFPVDSTGLRGHDCKLLKKRLDVRNFRFCNRVVDKSIYTLC